MDGVLKVYFSEKQTFSVANLDLWGTFPIYNKEAKLLQIFDTFR